MKHKLGELKEYVDQFFLTIKKKTPNYIYTDIPKVIIM